MALKWKKDKQVTGLARVCAAPVSHTLRDGDCRVAVVSPLGRGPRAQWFWVVGWESDLPRKNTCNEPVADIESAKTAAMAYVKEQMALLAAQPSKSNGVIMESGINIVKSSLQAAEIARDYAYRKGVNGTRAEAFAEVWFEAGKDDEKSTPEALRLHLDWKFNRV